MSQSFGNNITIDDYSYNASLVSALVAGDYVRIESIAEPTQFMAGPIVQWGGTGTDMIVSIEYISSGNEYYEWLIKLGVKIGANSITNLELADDSVTETKFSAELQTILGAFATSLESLQAETQKPHGVFWTRSHPDSAGSSTLTFRYFDNVLNAYINLFENIYLPPDNDVITPYTLPLIFWAYTYELIVDADSNALSSYSFESGFSDGILNPTLNDDTISFYIKPHYHLYLQITLLIGN